jgi:hypothetical protein
MPDTLRRNALCLALTGAAFCAFFQITKHQPRLSGVNPFSEDPYDSVGSFAVQFVLFMMLLSLLRAYRHYQQAEDPQAGVAIQVRGQLMAYVAIAFTQIADLIAMARHSLIWRRDVAGDQLLALTVCLLLWAASAAAFLLFSAPVLSLPPSRRTWIRLLVVPGVATLVLVFYPESVRRTLIGELVTVLCGIVLLFVVVWSIGTAFAAPALPTAFDLLDDLASLRLSFSERLRFSRAAKPLAKKAPSHTSAPILFGWLNPRRHRWGIVITAGILFGTFLVVQELGEGTGSPHGGKRLLVIVVYLALETAGVLTGYALLAEPLQLFRRTD